MGRHGNDPSYPSFNKNLMKCNSLRRRQVNLAAFVVEAFAHLSHAGFGFARGRGLGDLSLPLS
jgi:hypothetical protein